MKLTDTLLIELYDKYARRLFHTSLRIVSDAMDAEEIVNDTMLKLLSCQEEFSEDRQREAWLVKVCVRASIDAVRKRKSYTTAISLLKEEYSETEIDSGISEYFAENNTDTTKKIEAVKKALASLADGYRTILSLSMFEGYDHAEIAAITGIKESSVRSQYVRAKAKLLEILQNDTTYGRS